jgi:probable rRNA maturation factor
MGDIVLCAPVVAQEAREQSKLVAAHYAHLCVHGVLHLAGFDHETSKRAKVMESLEISVLSGLGFGNPY